MRLLLIMAFGLACLGCSKKKSADFTPASGDGRAALEAGLRSWKDGRAPGMVAGASKPAVQAEDFEWRAGQKLMDYQILGDEPPVGLGPRTFTVRLTTGSGAPREVKYMVLGIDPMLVYRDADFAKLSGEGK